MRYPIKKFERSYNRIPLGMADTITAELRKALRLKGNYQLKQHAMGVVSTHPDDLEKVASIFKKHGITPVFDEEY